MLKSIKRAARPIVLVPGMLLMVAMLAAFLVAPMAVHGDQGDVVVHGPFEGNGNTSIVVTYNSNTGVLDANVSGAQKWYYVVNHSRHEQAISIPGVHRTSVPGYFSGKMPVYADNKVDFGLLAIYPRPVRISIGNDLYHTGVYYRDHQAPDSVNLSGVPIQDTHSSNAGRGTFGRTPTELCIFPYDWDVPVTINGERTNCIYP